MVTAAQNSPSTCIRLSDAFAKGEQIKHTALWIGFLLLDPFDAKNSRNGQLFFFDSVLQPSGSPRIVSSEKRTDIETSGLRNRFGQHQMAEIKFIEGVVLYLLPLGLNARHSGVARGASPCRTIQRLHLTSNRNLFPLRY
jgi:hypothetical protein